MSRTSKSESAVDGSIRRQLVELGARIRQGRTELGFTREALADRLLSSRSTLQRIERGDSSVAIGVVLAAAAAVGVEALAADDRPLALPSARPRARRKRVSDGWFT